MLTETTHTAPDLEELAAYVEGRLSGERKGQVEERLVRDEEYYEVFLHSVRFQREEKARRRSERKVLRWRPWYLAPLAAAAVLAALVGFPRLAKGPGDFAAALDPASVLASGDSWARLGWSTRSAGRDSRSYRQEELAFRLGVRTVDLRVAVAGGDREAARTVAEDLEQEASLAGLRSMAGAFGDLKTRVESTELDALRSQLTEAEEYLARRWKSSPEAMSHLRFGQWVEAGRLAAASHDSDALARLRRMAPEGGESTALLTVVESFLEVRDPSADDYREVAAAFDEALRSFAG